MVLPGKLRFVAALALLVGASQAANASLLTLINDAGASVFDNGQGPDSGAWKGSEFVDVPPGMFTFFEEMEANVEFAVMKAPQFASMASYHSLSLPSGGTPAASEFVYLYQVVDVAKLPAGDPIGTFSVGIMPKPWIRGVVVPPTAASSAGGDVAPDETSDTGNSMFWKFLGSGGTGIHIGETSELLYYSSPFGPQMMVMQLNAGIVGPNPNTVTELPMVPSPVPEPSTLILVVLSAGGIFLLRRRG